MCVARFLLSQRVLASSGNFSPHATRKYTRRRLFFPPSISLSLSAAPFLVLVPRGRVPDAALFFPRAGRPRQINPPPPAGKDFRASYRANLAGAQRARI